MKKMLLAFLLLLGAATPAFAYSDPGSGLLLFQMLASTAVGGLFFCRKIKERILRKFWKDRK